MDKIKVLEYSKTSPLWLFQIYKELSKTTASFAYDRHGTAWCDDIHPDGSVYQTWCRK